MLNDLACHAYVCGAVENGVWCVYMYMYMYILYAILYATHSTRGTVHWMARDSADQVRCVRGSYMYGLLDSDGIVSLRKHAILS